MCGFNLLFSNSYYFEGNHIQKMNDAIKHRGPDDEGFISLDQKYKSNFFFGEDSQSKETEHISKASKSNFFLGHRRLSIMDTKASGYQPMLKDNRYVLVFNGEIYNYLEIAEKLNFQPNNDSEVIIEAYKRWGENCVNQFNGMWAFCLIDLEKETLFISRDRFGIKPLYYCFQDGKLAIASEIKSILHTGLFKIKTDQKQCLSYLANGSEEYSISTLFSQVYKFPKASYVSISLSDLSTFPKGKPTVFWDISTIRDAPNRKKSYFDLLKSSVELRLRSKVKVGSALSGGLDSSSIVSIVNELRKDSKIEQHTFSTVYNNDESKSADESFFINELVSTLSLKSHKIEPKLETLIEDHQKLIYIHDTPPNGIMIAAYNTFKLVGRTDVKVTLDGQGADEILAGYLKYIPNFLIHSKSLNKNDILSLLKIPRAKSYVETGLKYRRFRPILSTTIFKKFYHFCYNKPFLKSLPLKERLIYDINHNLCNLIHYLDRNSMAFSVESRTPFLDFRLVEYLIDLDGKELISKGWTKFVARKAMEKKLPKSIVWRVDKMGWENPTNFYFNGPLKTYIMDTINNSEILSILKKDCAISESNFNAFSADELSRMLNLSIWYNTFRPFMKND